MMEQRMEEEARSNEHILVDAAAHLPVESPVALAEAIALCERETKRQLQTTLKLVGYPILFFILIAATIATMESVLGKDWPTWISQTPWALVAAIELIVTTLLFVPWISSRRRIAETRKAARDAARLNDLSAIGPLLSALNVDDADTIRLARTGLTRLLTRDDIGTATDFTQPRRATLLQHLSIDVPLKFKRRSAESDSVGEDCESTGSTTQDFRVAILRAYCHIGGAQELATVRKLAKMKSKRLDRTQIRDAAAEALPFLEARAAEQQLKISLLRPSSSGGLSEPLLRPSESMSGELESILLRPDTPSEK